MRKIVLLMSIICLTAMAAGCEDNNMVVLMCEGGACPDGGGRTESEVQNPPQPGENDPDLGSQDPTNSGPGTQDPTQPVKPDPVNPEDPGDPTQSGPEAQDPTQPENPEPTDPGPCVGACNPTDPSNPEPGDPIAPSDGPGTGKSGDTCEVDADCDIKDNLVCQSGVCDVKENGPKPKCEEGNACGGCECLAPMECKNDVCVNSPSNPEPSGCEGNGKCDDIEECVNYKCVDRCSDKVCMAEQLCAHNYLVGNYVSSDCEGKLNHLDLVCNNNSLGWGVCAFDRNYWECKKEGSNYSWERDECGVGKRCIEVRYYMGILGAMLSGSEIIKVTVRCIDQK